MTKTSAFVAHPNHSHGHIRPTSLPPLPTLIKSKACCCIDSRVSNSLRQRHRRRSNYRTSSSRLFLDNVFSNEELAWGTLSAISLALLASYLQGRRSQNDFVLGITQDVDPTAFPSPTSTATTTSFNETAVTTMTEYSSSENKTNTDASVTTFDSWKEMSRPENYVWYNRPKAKQPRKSTTAEDATGSSDGSGNIDANGPIWSLLALLVVFGPIFSVEFFLTLSRQVLFCEGSLLELAPDLCAPIIQ